jgi:hypothetical protein
VDLEVRDKLRLLDAEGCRLLARLISHRVRGDERTPDIHVSLVIDARVEIPALDVADRATFQGGHLSKSAGYVVALEVWDAKLVLIVGACALDRETMLLASTA